MPQQGGDRCKHAIIPEYLEHRDRNIRSGLECELPVECEIPQNRQYQCRQIAYPVPQVKDFIEQREAADFNDTGTDGEQDELYSTLEFLFFCILYSNIQSFH